MANKYHNNRKYVYKLCDKLVRDDLKKVRKKSRGIGKRLTNGIKAARSRPSTFEKLYIPHDEYEYWLDENQIVLRKMKLIEHGQDWRLLFAQLKKQPKTIALFSIFPRANNYNICWEWLRNTLETHYLPEETWE